MKNCCVNCERKKQTIREEREKELERERERDAKVDCDLRKGNKG